MTLSGIARWVLGDRGNAVADPYDIEEISRDEVIRVIDEAARTRTGLSAHELLSGFRAGTLRSSPDVTDLLVYSDLLSPNDPIFEPAARAEEPEAHCALR